VAVPRRPSPASSDDALADDAATTVGILRFLSKLAVLSVRIRLESTRHWPRPLTVSTGSPPFRSVLSIVRRLPATPMIEMEIATNTLRFQCPISGRELDIGIGAHWGARLISIRLRCPICEDIHEWHESVAADSSVNYRTKSIQSARARNTRQDPHDPKVGAVELHQHLWDELNHKLKENLQILKDLLRTAWRKTKNVAARDVLIDTRRRIGAASIAQQMFYSARNSTDVSSQSFLDAVWANARAFFSRILITREPAGSVPKEIAIPLALALNELLTNAAADERGRTTIKVGLNQRPGQIELYVQDCGSGFDFEEVQARASGLGLVTTSARRLHGTFTIKRRSGGRCILRIPDQ
jgi:two-component sensor histidine kinase